MSVIVKAVEKVVDTVVKTVEAVINDPLPTLLTIAGQAVGIPAPITQAAIAAARGGDLEDIAKSAAIAYAAPTVAAKIAPAIGSAVGTVVTNEAAAQALTAATSQSLVAGSLTAATGGDWQQAAAGSFAGSMAASGYDRYVAPEVMQQAKSLGLSAETHANIQGALKSGIASGTGVLATGGDFATGFTNAVVESGWDNLTAKASEGLQDIKNTFLKDDGIKDNNPTFAGVPADMVDQVPMSLEGQLAQIEQMGKPAEYGKQYGPELAANETEYFLTPEDGDLSRYDFVKNKPASIMASPDEELGSIEVTAAPITDEDLKRAAITGDTALLKELTQFGELPSTFDEAPFGDASQSGYLSSKDISRLLSKANQSSAAAIDAQVLADTNPTPENIAAAEEAKMTAELDQMAATDAQQSTGVTPSAIQAETVPVPTMEQTNQNILNAIQGGTAPEGEPLPEDLYAGIEGIGTEYSALNDPSTVPQIEPKSGAPMPAVGAPMPQMGFSAPVGGLQFPTFTRVGMPTYDASPTSLMGIGPLSELDAQSIMMMSPEEYAARTKSGNIFRVARGGLIALKKQR